MAYSREIIKKITQYVRFRVPRTEEKDSYYTEIGNTLIRISNHCTWMKSQKNENFFSLGYKKSSHLFVSDCIFIHKGNCGSSSM